MSALCKNPFNHDVMPADAPLLNVQIDGTWVQVPKGLNVIEAAERFGKHVPHYCYHPKLSVVGNCRMCLIEMGLPKMTPDRKPVIGADGKPEIGWMPRPQIGCATVVSEGMGIRTQSPLVDECRKGVMEFLLINHPLDCTICDQAGECKLQETSVEYGQGESRFVENKVKKPKRVDIGKNIVLDDERCIMCSRCIRFAREVSQDDVLGFTQRGSQTTLTVHPGKRFDNNYSLNTVDICPVGALTSKDFRFKMRVWFLKETKSISTWDATGSNIVIGAREGKIHRITPRENEEVNSLWMPDSARFEFHEFEREDRFIAPIVKVGHSRIPAEWSSALAQVTDKLKSFAPGEIAILASAKLTNEELFLVGAIAKTLGVTLIDIEPRPQTGDGFLISNDGNPNTAGAKLLGVGQNGALFPKIASDIASGKVKALVSLTEDAVEAGIPVESLKKLEYFVHIGALPNEATAYADVILPGAGFGEKRGSLINVQGRLQRLGKAISTPGQAREDLEILLELKTSLGGGNGLHSVEEVFKALAATQPALTGLTYSRIGDQGVLLNLAGN
jgi:NADH-quinone oxidoreductase subunit G